MAGYTTERVFLISVSLSTEIVPRSLMLSASLEKNWSIKVLRLWKQHSVKHTHKHLGTSTVGSIWKDKFCLNSDNLVFICVDVSTVSGCYKINMAWYNSGCLCGYKLTAIWPPTKKGVFLEVYNVTSYGSGWKKDIVNWCLEFGFVIASYHW